MTPTLELILRELNLVIADTLVKIVTRLPALTTQIDGGLMRSFGRNCLIRSRIQRFKKFKPRL
jgi:hypothetical protein